MSNVIFLEFYDKKGFPPGKWLSEPDFCYWDKDLPCLIIRDMVMGIWRGFVGVDEDHPYYEKSVDEILKMPGGTDIYLSVHGGLCAAGRLPSTFKDYAKNYWWIGLETCHTTDLLPLYKVESNDRELSKMIANQTYKDIKFIRRETNKLSNLLLKVK